MEKLNRLSSRTSYLSASTHPALVQALKFSFFFGDDVLKGPRDQPHPIPKTFELTRDKVLLHTMHPASPALHSLFSYDLCYRRCGDYGMPTT